MFLSLWGVTSCLCIDKIPEVAKIKVSKPKRYSLSKVKTLPRPPKTAHSNTPRCGNICIRHGFCNSSSVEAAFMDDRFVNLEEVILTLL